MPYSIRIQDPKFRFSASHFLIEHEKCSRLHGHNYTVALELTGSLNRQLFVMDFFEVKQKLQQIITPLDHVVLLPTQSQSIQIHEKINQVTVNAGDKHYEFPKLDCKLLPIPATTAECLVYYIYQQLKPIFSSYTLRVELAESEGSIAIYTD